MRKIAFIFDGGFLYWDSIVIALGWAVGICLFLAHVPPGQERRAAPAAIPMVIVLSLVFGRVSHWYFRPDCYRGFWDAVTDYTSGGYTLMGVFAGCFVTSMGLRWMGLIRSPAAMLDGMGLGLCAGIAIGRLSCFFNAADRGQLLAHLRRLPFAYPVTNVASGEAEYRLATFVIQSGVSALIFIALVCFSHFPRRRRGDTALVFLLLYCLSQAVLDSTRYDSLALRSNGFVSIVQLLSALGIVAVSAVFAVRMVRKSGMKWWYLLVWAAMLALLGGAGYMEYFVQRHGNRAPFSYGIMSACLGGIGALCALQYVGGIPQKTSE